MIVDQDEGTGAREDGMAENCGLVHGATVNGTTTNHFHLNQPVLRVHAQNPQFFLGLAANEWPHDVGDIYRIDQQWLDFGNIGSRLFHEFGIGLALAGFHRQLRSGGGFHTTTIAPHFNFSNIVPNFL